MIPPGFAERFPNVSRESLERLDRFVGLLLAWQARINLISPSTIHTVWDRHVADSLQLLNHIPKSVTAIADLGSGGGLPGIVLACIGDWTVHLHEANQKKAAFLNEALRVTGGRGIVHRMRLEELGTHRELPQVQAITARALAPLDLLFTHSEPYFTSGATGYFHKGTDYQAELTQAAKSWKIDAIVHPSLTDSASVILEVKEIARV